MQVSTILAFATALAIAVAIPGPGIFAVVSCAISRGLRDTLGLIGGMIVGDLIYFLLAVLGMAALARSLGGVFLIVKLAGAAYLIWIGVSLWRQRAERIVLPEGGSAPARGTWRSIAAGMAVTLGNPKAIAFYAGLLPTFINLQKVTFSEGVAMCAMVVLVVGSIPTAYAIAASSSRRLLARPSRVTLFNRAAGTVMIGAGVTVAVR